MKIHKKMHLNWKAFRNLQSRPVYQYIKMYVLIKYKVCESLVKKQHFKHEWSSFMHKNISKTQQNHEAFHN